jgi:hypothetical protein
MEQSEYDEMLRNLVRIVAHQDIINERHDLVHQQQALINQRLTVAVESIKLTLEAIKDILGRGNGR